jgi:hypothetical protein
VGGRGVVHIGFSYRNLLEINCLEKLGVDGKIILKLLSKK